MADLNHREFSLNLGGVLVESKPVEGEIKPTLRVVFKVDESTAPDPNTAEVAVYNLKETTRALISHRAIETVLKAGYTGSSHVIFRGKLDFGQTRRESTDWISEFESTDGGAEVRDSRINVSFKSIGFGEAIKKAAEAMGLGLGNIEEKIRSGNIRGALSEFGNGLVMSGKASDNFEKLATSFGFEWSIQDEQIIMLEPGGVLEPSRAILLNEETGLIGSPQAGENGIVEARSLLIPSLRPGRKVQIESDLVSGFYRVERSVFVGDTWGVDWYTDIEAKPL